MNEDYRAALELLEQIRRADNRTALILAALREATGADECTEDLITLVGGLAFACLGAMDEIDHVTGRRNAGIDWLIEFGRPR